MQLTVREAAKVLNVSEKTIYRWINQGILPALRVNEQYRFHRAELLEWASSQKINVSPDFFKEPEAGSAPLPSLTDSLKAGGIHYRVGGRDREGALRALVDIMRLPAQVDREFLFQVLLARENLVSTGIGDGIAMPHVRNPIVLHVESPTITLCFLEKPVDFHALDGKPVGTLFALVSPTVRAHLHLISRLAFALHDPLFKAAIACQGAPEEILAEAGRLESALHSQSQHGGAGEAEES